MTARNWVEMLQSKAVSLKKFVMRDPERGKEGYCLEHLGFASMFLEARWPHGQCARREHSAMLLGKTLFSRSTSLLSLPRCLNGY